MAKSHALTAYRAVVFALTAALLFAESTTSASAATPLDLSTAPGSASERVRHLTMVPPAASSGLTTARGGVHQPWYDTGGPYPEGYHLEADVSVTEYRQFEAFYIIGKARLDATPRELTIFLEAAPLSGGSYKRIARTRSSSSGYYEFNIRPETEQRYRVVIARDWSGGRLATSKVMKPKFVGSSHTLEERRAELAWRLGDQTRSIRTMKPYQYEKYPFPAVAGRWTSFDNGILAEITRANGKVYTWLIEGPQLKRFLEIGGWTRRIGTPARDAVCVEIVEVEASCTQLFSGGAIYSNNRDKTVDVPGPSHWRMETVAAALSQTGFRESSWRTNKYNDWIGDDNAWCAVFVAWAGAQTRHADAYPDAAGFSGTLADLNRAGALRKGMRGLEPGAMVLFDFMRRDGRDQPTHMGLVVRASGSTVYTIEGNTTSGTGDPTRGVFARARSVSSVWGTADPEVYANR